MKKQSYTTYDVFAIETSNSNESIQLLIKLYPKARIYECGENLGYAGGNNYLYEITKGMGYDYGLVINPDTILHENFIEELLKGIRRESGAVLSGPLVYLGTPEHYRIQNYALQFNFKKAITRIIKYPEHEESMPEYETVQGVAGCAFMFDYKKIATTGLFCEDNFMYGDELDLAYRISKTDNKCVVTKRAKVWHNHNWSNTNKDGIRFQYFYSARNRFLFFHRYQKWHLLLFNLLSEILVIPVKIKWASKKSDIKLFFYYYLGIIHGCLNRKGRNKTLFK